MARDRSTYRSARRNFCIREQKMVWTPEWYFKGHRNTPEWFVAQDRGNRVNNQLPIYIETKKHKMKAATSTSDVHRLLKQGNYAAAVRRLYG